MFGVLVPARAATQDTGGEALSLVENDIPSRNQDRLKLGEFPAVQWLDSEPLERPGFDPGRIRLGRSCRIFEVTVSCRTRDVFALAPEVYLVGVCFRNPHAYRRWVRDHSLTPARLQEEGGAGRSGAGAVWMDCGLERAGQLGTVHRKRA